MGTKAMLKGRLPTPDLDGLSSVANESLHAPGDVLTVVMVLSVGAIETDMVTDDVTVKYRIEGVEAIGGSDENFILSTMREATARRTGRAPIDGFEAALRDANPGPSVDDGFDGEGAEG